MKNVVLAMLGATCLLAHAPVHADMRWTTEMKVDTGGKGGRGGGEDGPLMSFTTAVKAGALRKEGQMKMGPLSSKDVTISLCEKKQRIQIDEELKIYTVSPLTGDEPAFSNPMEGLAGAMPGGIPGMKPPAKNETGKIVSTITVEDLGEETVAEVKTRHYRLTTVMEKSGCAGKGTDTVKMEVWSANFDEPVFCPDSSPANPIRDVQNGLNPGCKITFENKGDGLEAYGKIFRGVIMRMKMFDNKGKPVMTQEVSMLTRAKQDDTLFQVPEGYKQVTAEEFQKQKSQAMLRKMFGGQLPGF